MSILVIWSSPDKDGLTAAAKDAVAAGVRAAGVQVEEAQLNEMSVKGCLACGKGGYGACLSKGTCSIRDDLQDVYDAMRYAEALAFVTPVYWHDLPENLKALLDRIRRMETSKNGYLQGKRYLAVACAGGYGLGATDALVRLEQTLGHMGMRALDRIPVVRFNRAYMLPALRQAGEQLARHHVDFRFDDFDYWE